MTDKQRQAFEAWLATKPEALYWNTSDAMLTAWTASRKLALEEAAAQHFEAGWRTAANWCGRDDLIADIGSPAYIRDRDAAIRQQQEGGK